MFLSSDAIEERVRSGALAIEPFDPRMLKPASYVLRLGRMSRGWRTSEGEHAVWPHDEASTLLEDVADTPLVLRRGELVLAASYERVSLPPDLVGFLGTLSHVARFGVSAHAGSNIVSPGFGHRRPSIITFELSSANPNALALGDGMPLCHMMLAEVSAVREESRLLATSAYDGDEVPVGPRLVQEFEWLVAEE